MAKYITRTIESNNTKVTFVLDKQLNEYILTGVVGKKEAKRELGKIFDSKKDVIIVSCEKVVESSKLYRMLESEFIKNAEVVANSTDTSEEV